MGYVEDWVLPKRSVLSGLTASELDLTPAEFDALLRLPKVCPVCAEPTPDGEVCGDCLLHPKAFDLSRCGFLYEAPISDWLQQLKYQGELYAGRLLAELFVMQLFADKGEDAGHNKGLADVMNIDCLLPVPLHLARFRARGFNQSAVLAKHLGRAVGIKVQQRAIKRIVDTPTQTQLDRNERKKNVRGAFAIDRSAFQNIKRVALVDDVLTTGSTANEIAQLIKRQTDVEWVEIWVIAKRL